MTAVLIIKGLLLLLMVSTLLMTTLFMSLLFIKELKKKETPNKDILFLLNKIEEERRKNEYR